MKNEKDMEKVHKMREIETNEKRTAGWWKRQGKMVLEKKTKKNEKSGKGKWKRKEETEQEKNMKNMKKRNHMETGNRKRKGQRVEK